MESHVRFWRVVLLAPPLLVFGLFVLWPLADSFRYSVTNWNGFSADAAFVGLENFRKIFTDGLFANAIVNSAIWMAAALVLPTGAGLALALLLDSGVRGAGVFKSIFYLPICLSSVVVGQIWIWIFQPDWGLLNTALSAASGETFGFAWLAKPGTALYAVIVAWSWQQTGLAMVIFLAGLTAIPRDLLEAAEVDGVAYLKQISHIILPMLRPATVVVIALSVINSLKGFDILYIMTGGGPFNSSDTLAMFMYDESFKKYKMGYGSAISVVLFVITLTIIFVYFKELKKMDEIYE
ncbi:MAG: sugar ABC transporter permease [Ancalomicrobiaceae bacterium]|nr:sugar ABC transporter permease [Ancalomicrobiaceae bacterium]